MLLDGKRLDEITEAELLELRDNKVPEGKRLDYKLELPGPKDSDKKEFLADVSSFANAGGGFLVYGVEEDRDEKEQPAGTPAGFPGVDCENQDAEGRRLDSIVRSGIEPRIPGYGMHWVPVQGNRSVLVIHVRKGWSSPHRVILQGHGHFYSRTVAGKYQLDVDELRAAFTGAEAQAKRLRDFRDGRLSRIISGETPVPLTESPKLVLHFVPVFDDQNLDVTSLFREVLLSPIYRMLNTVPQRLYNFDGVMAWDAFAQVGPENRWFGYAQVFRNGAIEAVDARLLRIVPQSANHVDGNQLVRITEEAFRRYIAVLQRNGIDPPIAVMLSLLHVRGLLLPVQNVTVECIESAELKPIRESDLILPNVLMEDWPENPASVLRPLFDMVWNACGYPYCTAPHCGDQPAPI